MPAVFIKIIADFKLHDALSRENDSKSIIEQYCEDGFDEFQVNLRNEQFEGPSITFSLKKSEIVSGVFEVNEAGDSLKINIDSIFKISPKSQYFEAVIDKNSKWYFDRILTIHTWDIEGLEVETYLVKNRFHGDYEAKRYVIDVKVALKKKDLE